MVEEHRKDIQRMLRDGGVGSDVQAVRVEERYFPDQLEVARVSKEELLEPLLGQSSDGMMDTLTTVIMKTVGVDNMRQRSSLTPMWSM